MKVNETLMTSDKAKFKVVFEIFWLLVLDITLYVTVMLSTQSTAIIV